jgi:hypothetical protein
MKIKVAVKTNFSSFINNTNNINNNNGDFTKYDDKPQEPIKKEKYLQRPVVEIVVKTSDVSSAVDHQKDGFLIIVNFFILLVIYFIF